jgi:hypothetical protein
MPNHDSPHRHCEERSDEAIQGNRSGGGAAPLDCFAARAARNDGFGDALAVNRA